MNHAPLEQALVRRRCLHQHGLVVHSEHPDQDRVLRARTMDGVAHPLRHVDGARGAEREQGLAVVPAGLLLNRLLQKVAVPRHVGRADGLQVLGGGARDDVNEGVVVRAQPLLSCAVEAVSIALDPRGVHRPWGHPGAPEGVQEGLAEVEAGLALQALVQMSVLVDVLVLPGLAQRRQLHGVDLREHIDQLTLLRPRAIDSVVNQVRQIFSKGFNQSEQQGPVVERGVTFDVSGKLVTTQGFVSPRHHIEMPTGAAANDLDQLRITGTTALHRVVKAVRVRLDARAHRGTHRRGDSKRHCMRRVTWESHCKPQRCLPRVPKNRKNDD
eukprot:RCo039963